MNTYTLLSNPAFVGFTDAGKQLWEIYAILPTGTEDFVVEIPTNTELAVHQVICAKITGSIVTVGQDPDDTSNGQSLPPPPRFSQLIVVAPILPNPQIYPTFNADTTTSIVSV